MSTRRAFAVLALIAAVASNFSALAETLACQSPVRAGEGVKALLARLGKLARRAEIAGDDVGARGGQYTKLPRSAVPAYSNTGG